MEVSDGAAPEAMILLFAICRSCLAVVGYFFGIRRLRLEHIVSLADDKSESLVGQVAHFRSD